MGRFPSGATPCGSHIPSLTLYELSELSSTSDAEPSTKASAVRGTGSKAVGGCAWASYFHHDSAQHIPMCNMLRYEKAKWTRAGHMKSRKLLDKIQSRLQQGPQKPDAKAARRAVDELLQMGWPCEETVFSAVRTRRSHADRRRTAYLLGQARWSERLLLDKVRAVLAPLAVTVIQSAFRRHARLERARRIIQRAVLTFLWRPGSWAMRNGCEAIA